MPSIPPNWLDLVKDQEVSLCSAALLLAVRSGKIGSDVMKLYVLTKALRTYMERKKIPLPVFFPLKWFRKVVRPLLGEEKGRLKSAIDEGANWGLFEVHRDKNAILATSPKSSETQYRIFDLLGMKREEVADYNSVTNIIWTTHALIGPRIGQVLNPEWSPQKLRTVLAAVFMWGLNSEDFFLTLDTFGRLFGVDARTVMRWSQRSGELSQRRSIPVIGTPWVPEWKVEDRPPHLQQVKKAIPNPNTEEFKVVSALLEKTRKWGDNGHRTPYFLYFHRQKRVFILARRIPNFHKPKGTPVKTERMDSNGWVKSRKLPFCQYMNKPGENDRIWYTPRQLRKIRIQTIKERKWAHYNSLDDAGKADYRKRVKEVNTGERMSFSYYDPMIGAEVTNLHPDKNFTDKGSWSEMKERESYIAGRTPERAEEARREREAAREEEKYTPIVYETDEDGKKRRSNLELQFPKEYRCKEKYEEGKKWLRGQIAYLEKTNEGVKYEIEERRQPRNTRPIRNIAAEIARARAEERMWKRSALNGHDGKRRPGINLFTTPIAPVWGRIQEEWIRLMPNRRHTPKWVRIYSLGHRQIVPKKRSIVCSSCHHTVSHLPHPQYHTSCPHCESVFAGTAGLAI